MMSFCTAKSQFFIRVSMQSHSSIAASLALNGMNFHKTKIAAAASAVAVLLRGSEALCKRASAKQPQ